MLLKSSWSGVLKISEIDAMKMAVRMKKSFIYRFREQDARTLERIGEGEIVTCELETITGCFVCLPMIWSLLGGELRC
jgi:hypothetical protein